MIAPIGAATFAEALRWGAETYHALKSVLKSRGLNTGPATRAASPPTCRATGTRSTSSWRRSARRLHPGRDIALALDVAATEFHADGQYAFEGTKRSADDMAAYYAELLGGYPLVSIEDPLDEEDWAAGRASPPPSATVSSSSATTCSSPTPSGSAAASSPAPRTRCWSRSTRSARSARPSTPSRSRRPAGTAA